MELIVTPIRRDFPFGNPNNYGKKKEEKRQTDFQETSDTTFMGIEPELIGKDSNSEGERWRECE